MPLPALSQARAFFSNITYNCYKQNSMHINICYNKIVVTEHMLLMEAFVKHVVLAKNMLKKFEQELINKYHVVAPVKKGISNYVFSHITSTDEIAEGYIPTVLPPKKFLMPQHETLLEFDLTYGQNMDASVSVQPMVIYGIRTCDIAGIQCLNVVFSDRPKDLHYLIRKNEMMLIGVECSSKCDEFACCGLMNNYTPNGGYDLFLTELTDVYYISVNTYEGEKIVSEMGFLHQAKEEHIAELKQYRLDKKDKFKKEIDVNLPDIPKIFERNQHSKIWEEIGEKCLSCANCTNVCPTCYCFDVLDDIDLNLTTGRRIRVWDSCQNEGFAKVAGGENFREERSARKRHRFNRKFKYPFDRYGRFFCTGCGRCSRTCMAGISLKDTIQALANEDAAK